MNRANASATFFGHYQLVIFTYANHVGHLSGKHSVLKHTIARSLNIGSTQSKYLTDDLATFIPVKGNISYDHP